MSRPERSQTDLEVLRSSHRGKFVTLGVLLAAAGGLWWFYNRTGPIGNDEDPSHVLVVTQSHVRYKPYLEQWGFVAQEGRLQTMEEEAKEKFPEEAIAGVPAILKLADWAGYAYVAFENPKNVDWTGVEVEGGIPSFEPHQRFAVVSAGDYAFPHKLTVNAKPSEVMRGADLDLLSALFAQEPLAGTLREDPKNPPEVMVLRGSLEEGIQRLGAVKDAESTVAKIADKARALLVDKEQGDPKPAMLGGIHESLNAIALADGSTLVLARQVHFSSTGYKAELELDRNWEFSYLPAGAAPAAAGPPRPEAERPEAARRPAAARALPRILPVRCGCNRFGFTVVRSRTNTDLRRSLRYFGIARHHQDQQPQAPQRPDERCGRRQRGPEAGAQHRAQHLATLAPRQQASSSLACDS